MSKQSLIILNVILLILVSACGGAKVTSTPEAEKLQFETYVHDIDCSVYNPDKKIKSFSILYPSGYMVESCKDNPKNYVSFTKYADDNQEDVIFTITLGGFHFEGSSYESTADWLLDLTSTQLGLPEATNTEPLEYDGQRLHRRDYVWDRDEQLTFLRIVAIPADLETGQGIIFVGYKVVESDPDAEFPQFDADTKKIIESLEFR